MVPQAAKAIQNAEVGTRPTKEQFAAQNAWLWYVEQLESGQATDPSGQYVRKSTVQDNGALRPKFTGFNENGQATDWGFGAYTANRLPGRPIQPACEDCLTPFGGGGIGGGGTSPTQLPPGGYGNGNGGIWTVPPGPNSPGVLVTMNWGPVTTFTSSVGRGGTGYISDLKILYNAQSTSHQIVVTNGGYFKLDTDLNKGAGGAYMYFAFTRNSNHVISGQEYTRGRPYSSPLDNLTSFETKKTQSARAGIAFFDIWSPTQDPNVYWNRADLNQGAGGDYIYSYQSKAPGTRNPVYISEVGVLSGNSSAIQPPAGWTKYGNDLNEGAGGDYVYFCYR